MDVAWFRQQLAAKGLTQREIAVRLWGEKRSESLIPMMYAGKRKMQLKEVPIWADAFGVPHQEVMVRAGLMEEGMVLTPASDTATVPVTGWVGADLRVHWGETRGVTSAPAPIGVEGKLEVVHVHADSGPLVHLDGALMYYQPSEDVALRAISRLAVVKVKGTGESLLCIVRHGVREGLYRLTTWAGPAADEEVELESASPVVWTRN